MAIFGLLLADPFRDVARPEAIFARKELRAGSFAVSAVSKSDGECDEVDGSFSLTPSFLRRDAVCETSRLFGSDGEVLLFFFVVRDILSFLFVVERRDVLSVVAAVLLFTEDPAKSAKVRL
eukprot:CAMPEP_0185807932 /NCGR_PEP_ID=MMETSP1322-20130828/5309_1 /TAXON_ID=265543 /ORGANISM="Minutocellus polymorphus, Strain RCC2270" /LENGTH=120 /DNA_ID=CAMNT_0028504117 /DNA_START=721 /DNA_END=1084 /DNA_ORIENTATION=-